MRLPSLKHRKPIVYISLSIYLVLIIFIIVESCLSSGLSGIQSNFIAYISAIFVNKASGPQESVVLKPNQITGYTDSSYLGEGKIALGTTSLVSFEVKYPDKSHSDDVYDKSFTVDSVLGNKDDYNLVLSSHESGKSFFADVRIVANNISSEEYSIKLKVADKLDYTYSFNIVEKEAPINYDLRLEKTTLKIGETSKVEIKLNPKEGRQDSDSYLRRYFDVTKLNHSSLNPAVADIDKYGVIHAFSTGTTAVTYGKETYDVEVTSQSIIKPAINSLNLSKSEDANQSLSLLDYDYVFEKNENPNLYSAIIYPTFEDTTLEDQNITYYLDNNLKAILAPYKYDDTGYPVYKDDLNRNCVRVCGYRTKGDVTLTVMSDVDNSIKNSLVLNVDEAYPTSMDLNVKNKKVYLGDQFTIKGIFTPKNVFSSSIEVTSNNNVVEIINNGTELITIKGKEIGTAHLVIKSKSNNSLTKEIDVEVTGKDAINDNNYSDFHTWIRKFAGHFILFTITSIFGALFFVTYLNTDIEKLISIAITLSIGFIVACVSELIQKYSATRNGSWEDVGIDFLGYFVGLALFVIVYLIIRLIKKKSHKNEAN